MTIGARFRTVIAISSLGALLAGVLIMRLPLREDAEAPSQPIVDDQADPADPADNLEEDVAPASTTRSDRSASRSHPLATAPTDIDGAIALLSDRTAADSMRNVAITILRNEQYPSLDDLLISILDDDQEGERFRSFAAQHLGSAMRHAVATKQHRAAEKLRTLLDDRHRAVRREALLALVRIHDRQAIDMISQNALAERWQPELDLIVACWGECGLRQRLSEIRALAQDQCPEVRIAAIRLLGQWRDQESRPLLEAGRASANERIQGACSLALERLAMP